ncbi:LBF_4227 family protein [Leptospira terpstrae]|uniref:LBF_4227 family protein n=1 Tax=Leptospira terpstrae TaxID=293075 RepID=UPI003CFEFAC8
MEHKESKQRKKGGIKAAFEDLVVKVASYLEVMTIYIQKNLQVYIKNLVLSSVWVFTSIFLIFLGLIYISYGVYLSLQKFLAAGDPILASFGTGFGFLLFAILFLSLVLRKK